MLLAKHCKLYLIFVDFRFKIDYTEKVKIFKITNPVLPNIVKNK